MDEPVRLYKKVRRHGLLLDTSILAVYLAGAYQEKTSRVGLLQEIAHGDEYAMLKSFLPSFRMYVTPHVLAETQGVLARSVRRSKEEYVVLHNGLELLGKMHEQFIGKDAIAKEQALLKEFGLVDTSLTICSKNNKKYLLTFDGQLEKRCARYANVFPIGEFRALFYNYIYEQKR